MTLLFVVLCLLAVIGLYFSNNPLKHSAKFMFRRFVNWFPLGMTYAFLYMGRYNLNVVTKALGNTITKEDFGIIFGIGSFVYALSLLLNGPLVDKIGGKRGILLAALGAAIFNGLMALVTYLQLSGQISVNLTVAITILYAMNMFFQSYGAVSIIKVKAYWFHVRERGMFGGIFGTLISLGVFFAFDWGQAIADTVRLKPPESMTWLQRLIRMAFAVDGGKADAIWLVFLIPSIILVFWALIDVVLLKDTPDEAGFTDFDPADASSDDTGVEFTMWQLLKKIYTNPIMLTVAFVGFTAGVLRNGIMQWYLFFAKENPLSGQTFLIEHWGLVMMVTGIVGGFAAGLVSDKVFHSRRGPPATIMNVMMFICMTGMAIFLMTSPTIVGCLIAIHALAVIGVHSIMSGTASADFGGRKATATATGITDASVYLGSSVQAICLGYIVSSNWSYWPIFLIPFTLLGVYLSFRMWHLLPAATRRYIDTIEKVSLAAKTGSQK
jgi:MFS transporter, OPA family, glycerol-3-phosphate transporter